MKDNQKSLDDQARYVGSNSDLLSQKRWQAILECKKEFLANKAQDPTRHPYMDKDVAASWIRSRNKGVDPYTAVSRPQLNEEQWLQILENHRVLVEITNSLTKSFREIMITCGYIFYLFDKTGVALINEGDWTRFPEFINCRSRAGIVIDEDSEGTTAHELCIRLKRPVQLLGPEHYCVIFQNSIATAAPVYDVNGETQAALVLISKPLDNSPGEDTLRSLGLHSFGLVTSMAAAIESQIKLIKASNDLHAANERAETIGTHLQNANNKLIIIHNTLNAAMGFIDEGIVTIDESGRILHINPAGMRILRTKPEEVDNRNIKEFLSSSSRVLDLAKKGEDINIEEQLDVGLDRLQYTINIRPIINQKTQKLDVAILKLNSSEKLTTQINSKNGGLANFTFKDIRSENADFKKSLALAQRFAASPENILLIGESGTGKELYAQAIHNAHRPQGPFMAVNCAAMPRELIESELFGYEGGSFTGAERSGRPGKIELAHGGTLFLDEIGDMPLEIQAVLLRTLEDKQVMRVGGSRYKKVDFRLIAATNKNLYNMLKENLFREDLYFRLSILTINIPPLRERGNDIMVLSEFFIENYCHKYGWTIPQISTAARKIINEYKWPGNVRQLQNAMIYAINTAQGDLIKPENLPGYIVQESCPIKVSQINSNNGNIGDMLCLENLEKAAIETALLHANRYVPMAAELLGISRSTLYRKLKDYNIEY